MAIKFLLHCSLSKLVNDINFIATVRKDYALVLNIIMIDIKEMKNIFIKSGKGLHYNWVSSKRNAPQILGSSITLIRDPLDKI